MRIAVSADNKQGLDSVVSPHFGRCPHFVLVDVEVRVDLRYLAFVDRRSGGLDRHRAARRGPRDRAPARAAGPGAALPRRRRRAGGSAWSREPPT